MSIENFPSLNQEEFAEACHHLESQYCRAELGSERARWRLYVNRALNTEFSLDGGSTTYVQIRRPLQTELDHGDLSIDLDNFSISDQRPEVSSVTADKEMLDAEESDEVRGLFSCFRYSNSHNSLGGSRKVTGSP